MRNGVNGFSSRAGAEVWEHALISGNGRQSALVHGGAGEPCVTLSHERLFLPVDEPLPAPHTARILGELRAARYGGRYRAAAERVTAFAAAEHPGYAATRWIDPLVGAARLGFAPAAPPRGGRLRTCDFTSGLAVQRWGGELAQEVFVSRPADVVVLRLTAPGGLTGTLRLTPIDGTPPAPVEFAVHATADRLSLDALFPGRHPGALGGYAVRCRVVPGGGTVRVTPDGGGLAVRGAPGLLLLARTTVGAEPDPAALAALPADFDRLLAEHARVHGELFGRARVRLGGRPAAPATDRSGGAAPAPDPPSATAPALPDTAARPGPGGRRENVHFCPPIVT